MNITIFSLLFLVPLALVSTVVTWRYFLLFVFFPQSAEWYDSDGAVISSITMACSWLGVMALGLIK